MLYDQDDLYRSLDRLSLDQSRAAEFAPADMIAEYTVGTEYLSEAGADPELVQWSAIVTYAILSELARGEFETYGAALARGDLGTYGSTLAPRELTRRLRTDAQVGLLGRNSFTGGISFGVVIDLADTEGRGRRRPGGVVRLPRLNVEIPMLVVPAVVENHGPNPVNATTTCWGRRGDRWGVLTAGHAVEHLSIGQGMAFDDGSVAWLVDTGYRPVDAAFLETQPPAGHAALLTERLFPAPGLPVDVHTNAGIQQRVVVSTGLANMAPAHRDYGMFFVLDTPLSPGDSGARVSHPDGAAYGLYIARQYRMMPDGSRSEAGLAQSLAQAKHVLRIQDFWS